MTDPPSFSFHLISKHRTALERQIWESLYIEHEECDELLNGKGEWGLNILPRLKPTPENDPLNFDLPEDETKSNRKWKEIHLKRCPPMPVKISSQVNSHRERKQGRNHKEH